MKTCAPLIVSHRVTAHLHWCTPSRIIQDPIHPGIMTVHKHSRAITHLPERPSPPVRTHILPKITPADIIHSAVITYIVIRRRSISIWASVPLSTDFIATRWMDIGLSSYSSRSQNRLVSLQLRLHAVAVLMTHKLHIGVIIITPRHVGRRQDRDTPNRRPATALRPGHTRRSVHFLNRSITLTLKLNAASTLRVPPNPNPLPPPATCKQPST